MDDLAYELAYVAADFAISVVMAVVIVIGAALAACAIVYLARWIGAWTVGAVLVIFATGVVHRGRHYYD